MLSHATLMNPESEPAAPIQGNDIQKWLFNKNAQEVLYRTFVY